MPRSRRKTQRGRGPPESLPRVFVACHTPSVHGPISWEDHSIVGYVDIGPGSSPPGDAPYYRGWDAIPSRLAGTIDIVLWMYCPVAAAFRANDFTWEPPAEPWLQGITEEPRAILKNSLRLLRPGGIILLPSFPPEAISQATRKVLRSHGVSVEDIEIPKPRWSRHPPGRNNSHFVDETLIGIRLTRLPTGGRRRHARSSVRKSIRS